MMSAECHDRSMRDSAPHSPSPVRRDRLRRRLRKKVMRLSHIVLERLLSPTYSHACTCCGRRVRAFLPIDADLLGALDEHGWPYGLDSFETLSIERYYCPHCGATDRERLYALVFTQRRRGGENREVKVLDIAPSRALGRFLDSRPGVRRRTADLFQEGVDDVVDIQRMDRYEDESFDVFVCSHVLEHVDDDRSAMRELHRVLRPGGWGIAMVPICLAVDECHEDPSIVDEAARWRHFAQGDHVRLYSKRCFVERLAAAGFVVRQLGMNHFGERELARIGATPGSVVYIVERSSSEQD
jgi:SAM-dependent methyltransferase